MAIEELPQFSDQPLNHISHIEEEKIADIDDDEGELKLPKVYK